MTHHETVTSLPDGIVLLHGGGNFGDEWPEHQRLREQILREHRDRPVVVLPQAVQFSQATVEACPDATFALGRPAAAPPVTREPLTGETPIREGLHA
jgi:exopolysaccharide biosynthesis predicted pyruvyltransferase EpsI